MFKHKSMLLPLFFLFFFLQISHGEIGTASSYSAPYAATACYGDPAQFPSNNLFAAAGDGIWDNGASCGRQYLVRCISSAMPMTCIPGQLVRVMIVDRAQTSTSRPLIEGTTMVLSKTAYETIANSTASSINIEFQDLQVVFRSSSSSGFDDRNREHLLH